MNRSDDTRIVDERDDVRHLHRSPSIEHRGGNVQTRGYAFGRKADDDIPSIARVADNARHVLP